MYCGRLNTNRMKATMTPFHVTYEVVTPESAEHGDYAEIGYAMPHGWRFPLEQCDDMAALGLSLREATRMVGHVEDCGRWFAETSGDTDYRTGAETRLNLHPPKNITPSSYRRLKRLLKA